MSPPVGLGLPVPPPGPRSAAAAFARGIRGKDQAEEPETEEEGLEEGGALGGAAPSEGAGSTGSRVGHASGGVDTATGGACKDAGWQQHSADQAGAGSGSRSSSSSSSAASAAVVRIAEGRGRRRGWLLRALACGCLGADGAGGAAASKQPSAPRSAGAKAPAHTGGPGTAAAAASSGTAAAAAAAAAAAREPAGTGAAGAKEWPLVWRLGGGGGGGTGGGGSRARQAAAAAAAGGPGLGEADVRPSISAASSFSQLQPQQHQQLRVNPEGRRPPPHGLDEAPAGRHDSGGDALNGPPPLLLPVSVTAPLPYAGPSGTVRSASYGPAAAYDGSVGGAGRRSRDWSPAHLPRGPAPGGALQSGDGYGGRGGSDSGRSPWSAAGRERWSPTASPLRGPPAPAATASPPRRRSRIHLSSSNALYGAPNGGGGGGAGAGAAAGGCGDAGLSPRHQVNAALAKLRSMQSAPRRGPRSEAPASRRDSGAKWLAHGSEGAALGRQRVLAHQEQEPPPQPHPHHQQQQHTLPIAVDGRHSHPARSGSNGGPAPAASRMRPPPHAEAAAGAPQTRAWTGMGMLREGGGAEGRLYHCSAGGGSDGMAASAPHHGSEYVPYSNGGDGVYDSGDHEHLCGSLDGTFRSAYRSHHVYLPPGAAAAAAAAAAAGPSPTDRLIPPLPPHSSRPESARGSDPQRPPARSGSGVVTAIAAAAGARYRTSSPSLSLPSAHLHSDPAAPAPPPRRASRMGVEAAAPFVRPQASQWPASYDAAHRNSGGGGGSQPGRGAPARALAGERAPSAVGGGRAAAGESWRVHMGLEHREMAAAGDTAEALSEDELEGEGEGSTQDGAEQEDVEVEVEVEGAEEALADSGPFRRAQTVGAGPEQQLQHQLQYQVHQQLQQQQQQQYQQLQHQLQQQLRQQQHHAPYMHRVLSVGGAGEVAAAAAAAGAGWDPHSPSTSGKGGQTYGGGRMPHLQYGDSGGGTGGGPNSSGGGGGGSFTAASAFEAPPPPYGTASSGPSSAAGSPLALSRQASRVLGGGGGAHAQALLRSGSRLGAPRAGGAAVPLMSSVMLGSRQAARQPHSSYSSGNNSPRYA